ncbi:MAG: class I SAM-dependent methyltransferase [Acidimicrobiia bacterium]
MGAPCARPLLEAARFSPGETVLDVACGTGVAARLAAEEVGPAGTVAGVDMNPGMLEVARAASPEGTSIEWRQAQAEHLPVPDDSYDAVLCSCGFQFFADKVAALQEIRRVLTPDGRMVLGTPGPTPPLFRAIDEVVLDHLGPEASEFVTTVFSVHDPAVIRGLTGDAGFRDVGVESRHLTLRLPPPAEFFWQYVHSTPLSAHAARLDDEAQAALERDVVGRGEPFTEGDTLVMELDLVLTTARPDPSRQGGE